MIANSAWYNRVWLFISYYEISNAHKAPIRECIYSCIAHKIQYIYIAHIANKSQFQFEDDQTKYKYSHSLEMGFLITHVLNYCKREKSDDQYHVRHKPDRIYLTSFFYMYSELQ